MELRRRLIFAITDIATIDVLGVCVADVTVVFITRSVCSGAFPSPDISPSLTTPPSVCWGLVLMMSSPVCWGLVLLMLLMASSLCFLQGQFAVKLLRRLIFPITDIATIGVLVACVADVICW